MPREPDRVGCRHPGCAGAIEAWAPLWLSLHADGTWSVYGVGDEAAEIICDEHSHNNLTTVLHKSLSAFLDELLPNGTWQGARPAPGDTPEL
ncbi:hypothetical protein E1264_02580 [Actinomadura sp. KC216]|uniref:hypothetical protein n=1 Tax=unclassified Actinomadura TaxID=2626254 RepID=UPI001043DDB5|nr:hypothetical protein [Actinomadura sp. KC216]TDB91196.1 hypothetical protein E1264_02580 [Actinomadura sp. KC216]